ncbi:MAG: hypothetical protein II857_12510 [Selenomonadaceae bacterium]|nr:hypothetical protein [Selenomonadaceae bacterium]
MNDDNLNKPSEPKPRNEGDARFDVTSLDEVKDENGNGIFHMTTRFKWILALSILILLAAGVLIYSAYKDALVVEIWQLAIWCVCVMLAFYSVIKRSLAAVILNLILFFGVSLIPVWQSAHENFQAVFKLFFG